MDSITSRIIEFTEWLKQQTPGKPGTIDAAQVEALRNLINLSNQIRKAIKPSKLLTLSAASQDGRIGVGSIVGKSQTILEILGMVDKIAPTQASVLILGESGTGKELIARELHNRSNRSNEAYVTVNCGALQETLLESELFGHEKGSFTGAVTQKIGLVESADGGTLFLDEVGELSPAMQTKLLRFLQEGEFYRVGGKDPLHVDVRIISATNRDLDKEVKAGRFREDLFYRLNTISLTVPALRARSEDIPLLVEHFLKPSQKAMAPDAMEALRAYPWPGNIRELQNAMERVQILSDGQTILPKDLPDHIRAPGVIAHHSPSRDGRMGAEYIVNTPLDDVEKTHILRTLEFNRGNKTRTAQKLGITIKTLYNKLHRYGVPIAGSPQSEAETSKGPAHGAQGDEDL